MQTRSSQPAAREFRADRVPVPRTDEARQAAIRLEEALATGRRIDLEVGCGVGWHPIRYALENPDRVLVAIERTSEKFTKFSERLARHPEIPNLIPVHADAVGWVTHFAKPSIFSRIFLLYPNPNVQNPQARWIRMPFFGRLLESLKPGGALEIRTNVADYAAEIRNYYAQWGATLLEDRAFHRDEVAPSEARTHFEKKYLERGEVCFSISLTRPEEALR
jgi:tRNA (guanine-N7-)-methyltransferase